MSAHAAVTQEKHTSTHWCVAEDESSAFLDSVVHLSPSNGPTLEQFQEEKQLIFWSFLVFRELQLTL